MLIKRKRMCNKVNAIIKIAFPAFVAYTWPRALPRGNPQVYIWWQPRGLGPVLSYEKRSNGGGGLRWGSPQVDVYICIYVYAGCPRWSLWVGKRRCIDYEKWMTLMKKWLTMIKMEDYDKSCDYGKKWSCVNYGESVVDWRCEISVGSAEWLGEPRQVSHT